MSTVARIVLTEKTGSLNYIKESGTREDGKHYLGKLAGIGAKFTEPTRNGRRYPYELWVNVENSDDFKEGMATLTIFGEADHPETRIDTSIKEIAIVLTKFEIRKTEGIVYVEFDILDTPNGRILKELLDYGSQIGVSSRGLGDEIVRDGETIIDPDTYVFYGFDAVVMPAVKSARPAVVESADRTKLAEQFQREIESASTKAELDSIKRIVEATKMPELDSVIESINIKLDSYENGDDISSKLEADLGALATENENLKQVVEDLKTTISANNIRIKQLENLVTRVKKLSESKSKRIAKVESENATLQDEIFNGAEQISDLSKRVDSYKVRLESMTSKFKKVRNELFESRKLVESTKADCESQLTTMSESHKEAISKLTSDRSRLESEVRRLTSDKTLVESRAQTRTSNISKKLTNAQKETKVVTKKYMETRCAQEGISVDTLVNSLPSDYTIDDIDKKLSELSDRNRRFSKLPIVMQPVSVKLEESSAVSEEDRQTFRILTGKIN